MGQENIRRVGVFVGSFNPFTIGHDNVVRRALPLFDRLVIGVVGDQVHKPDMPSAEERIKAIQELYAHEPCIDVRLTTDWPSTLPENREHGLS